MNRTLLLAALAGALLLAGLAAWMLSAEPEAAPGTAALRRTPEAGHGAPGFRSDTGEKPAPAVQPERAESLPATADVPALAAPDPVGPVRRISGRVVRLADDSPLGGVVVARVAKGEGGGSVPAPGGETTDAADGSFALAAVPVAETELCVTLGDRTSYYPLPEVEGDIDGVLLTFDSGFVLRGLVTDSGGTPIAGASAGIGARALASTDDAGRFELRDVLAGKDRLSVDMWAEAPWFVRGTRAITAPTDSRQLATVELALQGSGAIEGRVTDPQRKPVDGTEVRIVALMTAQHGQAGEKHSVTSTDGDGRYRLDHVPEGRYLVQVGTEAWAAPPAGGEASDEEDSAALLAAAAAADQQGVRARGLVARWIPDVEVQAGAATRLDVELDRGAVIEGRVTDSSGARTAGAKVTLERLARWPAPDQSGSSISFDGTVTITSRGGGEPGVVGETLLSINERSAETGADGSYRFDAVSAGDKRLSVIDAEQLSPLQKRELSVAGTETHSAVDFVLTAGLQLRGRVTDPGGAPLQDVAVNVKPEGTQLFTSEGQVLTDEDGWFQAEGLAEGPHSMMLNKSGYGFRHEQVQPGDVPRTWVLQPAPQLTGLVLDAVTDEPVLRYSITIAREHSINQSGHDDHPAGRFTQEVDDDTPCTVIIEALGYEPETKEGIIPSLTAAAPVTFRLKPAP